VTGRFAAALPDVPTGLWRESRRKHHSLLMCIMGNHPLGVQYGTRALP